jgi:hypothetical protein
MPRSAGATRLLAPLGSLRETTPFDGQGVPLGRAALALLPSFVAPSGSVDCQEAMRAGFREASEKASGKR